MPDEEKVGSTTEGVAEVAAPPVAPTSGAFIESLKRNNKQIRDDRAAAIGETAELHYKRLIEDLTVEIRQMQRDQENMLDMSPDNALSLKVASDFNAPAYVAKDIELGCKIRNATIKLNIAKTRYEYLFGGGGA
jgi:hypothetical protein